MAGIFYLTCLMLIYFNLRLLFYMKAKNIKSQSSMGNYKYIIILTVFSVSYLYRAIYDTLMGFSCVLLDLYKNNQLAW